MASHSELSDFLQSVERRAFRQAAYAVRWEDAALDIVQEAMFKLAERYANKPAAELPRLFQRILQTTIVDHFRRESSWPGLLAWPVFSPGEDEFEVPAPQETGPEAVGRLQVLGAIAAEVERLPPRQRQAFLLRYWEELDVAATAREMGCSPGSVKVHCSRAAQALARALRARGIEP